MSSVDKAFRPAFEEISRRKAASSVPSVDTVSHFSTCGVPASFDVPGQEYVLLTLGTSVLAPRPLERTRPSARVYGAFPTRDDALEHAEVVRERDQTCSLLIVRRGAWVLLPTDEATRDDSEAAAARIAEKLDDYAAHRFKEREDFVQVVNEKASSRPVASAASANDPEEEREMREAEALVYQPPKRLRAGAEVRGQGSAVVCVLPDRSGGEALLKVVGCFETSADADNWCRDVGSRHITDHDLFVTSTCEWFFPNGDGQLATRERYRITELQCIMDAAYRNPEGVRSYKEWKRLQEQSESSNAASSSTSALAESTPVEPSSEESSSVSSVAAIT